MEKLLSIITLPFTGSAKSDSVKPADRRRVLMRTQVQSRTTGAVRAQGIRLVPALVIAAAIVNLGLFLTYLYTVNAYANSGYAIRQLEKRIAEKESEYKKLLVQRSEANSMASVDEAVSSGAFVPVNAGELLYVPNGHFTQK